jgi:DNA-binding PadR family transcriptional regulator
MSERSPLLTRQTMVILSILMENGEPVAGSAIATASRLASGTLYPILIRLEEAGWIRSEWEDKEKGSKPRRRLYSVTGLGIKRAREEATAWKPLVERFV